MKVKTQIRRRISNFFVLAVFFVGSIGFAGDRYPSGPNPETTPGSLCSQSNTRRYPEGIVYCKRDVSSELKNQLIKMYDERFGYGIRQMDRGEFKIDHFIPLSIGGSNSEDNLWPQHRSVYDVTDRLEQLLSDKISHARIKQAEAVRVIREAKMNLGRVPELVHYVEGL